MEITVLHVPDCPSLAPLGGRLAEVLDGRADVRVVERVVADERQAAALEMAGSPTLLVDGVDPFARPGQPPSVSCRLYADERGHLGRAPSIAQLREVLRSGPDALR